jgi:RimJ/RimL family protein N-acetyltransferase
MFELNLSQIQAVLPLISSLDQAVLPRAVLEGTTAGWVFADDRTHPTSALIGLPCGYFFGAGKAPEGAALTAARRLVNNTLVPRSQAGGNFGFIFSFGGEDWIKSLPILLLGRSPFHIYRRAFSFDAERFAQAERSLPPLPEGFAVRAIDADLLSGQPGMLQEILGTWPSAFTFQKHGCGAAVLRGAEVASTCLAAFATAERMEISVTTAEAYRRRGFARQAAAAFIRGCLELGKQPNWDCFWDNAASTALAQSLGFSVQKEYPIFYWEEKPEDLSVSGKE